MSSPSKISWTSSLSTRSSRRKGHTRPTVSSPEPQTQVGSSRSQISRCKDSEIIAFDEVEEGGESFPGSPPRLWAWSPSGAPPKKVQQRLILCVDGTLQDGERVEHATNTYALFKSLEQGTGDEGGFYQRIMYLPGIACADWEVIPDLRLHDLGMLLIPHGKFRKLLSLGGHGIEKVIAHCFKVLLEAKRDDKDELVFIGFSRGAFLLRMLAAFIGKYGFHQFQFDTKTNKARSQKDREIMVDDLIRRLMYAHESLPEMEKPKEVETEIKVIAVFDTVGSLLRRKRTHNRLGVNYEYLHTELPETHFMTFRVCDIGPWVKNFIHAVALDEMSTWFCATLGMRPPEKLHGDTKFRQVLFAGMHGDVGGRNSRSRKALAFMTAELTELGIRIDLEKVKKQMLDPTPVIGEPYASPLIPPIKVVGRGFRNFLEVEPGTIFLHSSLAEPDAADKNIKRDPAATEFLDRNKKDSTHDRERQQQKYPQLRAEKAQQVYSQSSTAIEKELLARYNELRKSNVWQKAPRQITKPTTWWELEVYVPVARGSRGRNNIGRKVGGAGPRRERYRTYYENRFS